MNRELAHTFLTRVTPRYLAWLSFENANGANICVAANPLRSGSRKRTKENIASERYLYIDNDEDGDAPHRQQSYGHLQVSTRFYSASKL